MTRARQHSFGRLQLEPCVVACAVSHGRASIYERDRPERCAPVRPCGRRMKEGSDWFSCRGADLSRPPGRTHQRDRYSCCEPKRHQRTHSLESWLLQQRLAGCVEALLPERLYHLQENRQTTASENNLYPVSWNSIDHIRLDEQRQVASMALSTAKVF